MLQVAKKLEACLGGKTNISVLGFNARIGQSDSETEPRAALFFRLHNEHGFLKPGGYAVHIIDLQNVNPTQWRQSGVYKSHFVPGSHTVQLLKATHKIRNQGAEFKMNGSLVTVIGSKLNFEIPRPMPNAPHVWEMSMRPRPPHILGELLKSQVCSQEALKNDIETLQHAMKGWYQPETTVLNHLHGTKGSSPSSHSTGSVLSQSSSNRPLLMSSFSAARGAKQKETNGKSSIPASNAARGLFSTSASFRPQ